MPGSKRTPVPAGDVEAEALAAARSKASAALTSAKWKWLTDLDGPVAGVLDPQRHAAPGPG